MSDTRANTPSVVERTRPVKVGAPVVAAHFLGQTAVFVLGEGALVLAPRAGEARRVPVLVPLAQKRSLHSPGTRVSCQDDR